MASLQIDGLLARILQEWHHLTLANYTCIILPFPLVLTPSHANLSVPLGRNIANIYPISWPFNHQMDDKGVPIIWRQSAQIIKSYFTNPIASPWCIHWSPERPPCLLRGKDYTTNQLVIKNESPFELVYKLEMLWSHWWLYWWITCHQDCVKTLKLHQICLSSPFPAEDWISPQPTTACSATKDSDKRRSWTATLHINSKHCYGCWSSTHIMDALNCKRGVSDYVWWSRCRHL